MIIEGMPGQHLQLWHHVLNLCINYLSKATLLIRELSLDKLSQPLFHRVHSHLLILWEWHHSLLIVVYADSWDFTMSHSQQFPKSTILGVVCVGYYQSVVEGRSYFFENIVYQVNGLSRYLLVLRVYVYERYHYRLSQHLKYSECVSVHLLYLVDAFLVNPKLEMHMTILS